MQNPASNGGARRLVVRDRVLLVLAAAASVAVVVAVVPRAASPLERLVNVDSDGPGPIYNVPIDVDAIRAARAALPRDAVYYIHPPQRAHETALFHDILATANHELLPSVPARDLRTAGWVLSYQAPTLLPNGVRARRVTRVGDRVFVVELAR